ncbi:alpha/beta-hydrolase family protein [Gordonia neofelifaecis]|uniref:Alpha/beta-hydrolase catalytic domain-containing protein n=1 Tax=Gordonia neofelifaecis NRRL B-59395 TaxID=644548 RepID=F1YEX0_9ACTN|nr:alpha/beta-hydrolase family protein [Gordonia neofelifaecis]EGD56953.1 hypothetical protein SCNU_01205 [Gordonia neofelifaecis NRRL B-59395]
MSRLRIRPAVAVGALVGRLLALAPGMLPQSALIATVAGVVLTLAGMGVGALVGQAVDRYRNRAAPAVSGAWLGAGLLVSSAVLGFAVRHELSVRAAVGAPPVGTGWVLAVGLIPIVAALAVVVVPARIWVGGSLASLVAVTALHLPAPAQASGPDVPDSRAMIYGPLTESGTFDQRADRLTARWSADGGLDQRAVVIAVPTGSGWVDAGAVDGFVRHFDGSVRVLALQYDDVASWRAFVSSPDHAGDSATALLASVERRLATVPPDRRPRVYLAGQSLGAVGADAARRWANASGVDLAGTVLAGPPAGTVEDVRSCERRVVLANADDPVPAFRPALLWRPVTRIAGDDGDRQRADALPWLPVASMVGTVLDLAGSLKVPTGHGHRYGVEQGLAVASMPSGCAGPAQPMGPRAAS